MDGGGESYDIFASSLIDDGVCSSVTALRTTAPLPALPTMKTPGRGQEKRPSEKLERGWPERKGPLADLREMFPPDVEKSSIDREGSESAIPENHCDGNESWSLRGQLSIVLPKLLTTNPPLPPATAQTMAGIHVDEDPRIGPVVLVKLEFEVCV